MALRFLTNTGVIWNQFPLSLMNNGLFNVTHRENYKPVSVRQLPGATAAACFTIPTQTGCWTGTTMRKLVLLSSELLSITTGLGLWLSLNYKETGAIFYPSYSINMYNEQQLCAKRSGDPSEQDRYSLEPFRHKGWLKARRAWNRSLRRFPWTQSQRDNCPVSQLHLTHSHPKAGIPPPLPSHFIVDNSSPGLTLTVTVPVLTGLLWGPNESELFVPSVSWYHKLNFTSSTSLLNIKFFQWGLFKRGGTYPMPHLQQLPISLNCLSFFLTLITF